MRSLSSVRSRTPAALVTLALTRPFARAFPACLAAACALALSGCGTFSTTASTPTETAPIATTPAPTPAPDLSTALSPTHRANIASATGDEEPIATTNVRRVTFGDEGEDFDPSISADGTKLVFASTQHRSTSDIYIKRINSRVVTQLTNDNADDASPAISPDGTKIAFASNRSGNWDVYIMPITGGKAVQVTADTSDEVQPSWSPDGTKIVYARAGRTGRWELWISALSNNTTAHFIGYGVSPKWCPVASTGENGADKILYQLSRERGRRSFSLWTLDYAEGMSSNATELIGSSDAAMINPAWSADGSWVAFAKIPLQTTSEDSFASSPTQGASPRATDLGSLWMVSVTGDASVRLTGSEASALSPVWANDNTLYYVTNRSGRESIWSLSMAPAIRAAQAAMSDANTATADANAAADTTDNSAAPMATASESTPDQR